MTEEMYWIRCPHCEKTVEIWIKHKKLLITDVGKANLRGSASKVSVGG
jgi:hypothetical protein